MHPSKRQMVVTTQFPPRESIDEIAKGLRRAHRYGELIIHLAPNGGIQAVTLKETILLPDATNVLT